MVQDRTIVTMTD